MRSERKDDALHERFPIDRNRFGIRRHRHSGNGLNVSVAPALRGGRYSLSGFVDEAGKRERIQRLFVFHRNRAKGRRAGIALIFVVRDFRFPENRFRFASVRKVVDGVRAANAFRRYFSIDVARWIAFLAFDVPPKPFVIAKIWLSQRAVLINGKIFFHSFILKRLVVPFKENQSSSLPNFGVSPEFSPSSSSRMICLPPLKSKPMLLRPVGRITDFLSLSGSFVSSPRLSSFASTAMISPAAAISAIFAIRASECSGPTSVSSNVPSGRSKRRNASSVFAPPLIFNSNPYFLSKSASFISNGKREIQP
jgi:hypothetical protein